MDIRPFALYQAVLRDLHLAKDVKGWPCSPADIDCSALDRNTDLGLVASGRLLESITKKYVPEGGDSTLHDKALQLFIAENAECAEWDTPAWGTWEREVLDTMHMMSYQDFGSLLSDDWDWQDALVNMAPGPGSSVGSGGRNSALEKLFANPLTTASPELYPEFRKFMAQSPLWNEAELLRNARWGRPVDVVRGSTLSTVLKDRTKNRSICTEPSLDMLFQKALSKSVFEPILELRYGFSTRLQPTRNQQMALRGSLDGSSCTIDLTSASNLNAQGMIGYVFPPVIKAAINDCRCDWTSVPGSKSAIQLHMVSSMGNGFTFLMMTYLFSLMLRAVCSVEGKKFTRFSKQEFGVFGDDIICPTELYAPVVRALFMLGHKPNMEKSFHDGAFRESCGADCFNGANVRGVYCKSLGTDQKITSLINRLNRWSATWHIALPKTVEYLLSLMVSRPLHVPPCESDDAGIHVPGFMRPGWPTDSDVVKCDNGQYYGPVWHYLAYRPKRKVLQLFRRDRSLRGAFDTPAGVILAASVGWLRSSGVSRRREDDEPLDYDLVGLFTPQWSSQADLDQHGVDLQNWESATVINLTQPPAVSPELPFDWRRVGMAVPVTGVR